MSFTAILSSGCETSKIAMPTTAPQLASTATQAPTFTAQPISIPTSTPLSRKPTANPTATAQPPDVLFRYTNAVQLLRAAQYEDAIPQFGIVIRVLPDFAKAYHWRGLAYYNDDQKELALEDFNKAIELKPSFADAYRNRAVLYLNKGNIKSAIFDIEQALSIYQERGDSEKAKEVMNLLNNGKTSR